ncbi:MAG: hypothetical protein KatS3mg077_1587 [Candidatus Binatia bacterium]|nr:MAG: hypothetical protein KatS3mg077_1587 [Candidatus Binatia bacterium]
MALALPGHAQRLCSGGTRDGQPCTDPTECPGGACVNAQGVCDGGTDDGLDCDCALGVCSAAPACPSDPELGACTGGLFAGQCCDPTYNCSDGSPCTPTQKVCLSGPLKGLSCLRDQHCLGAPCWAVGRVCDDGFACTDDDDCISGTCEGTGNFPTPTPTLLASPTPTPLSCVGDCDGDGAVTIDNILSLVNIALGQAAVTTCPSGDANGDGMITVNEIVLAVNAALAGCL